MGDGEAMKKFIGQTIVCLVAQFLGLLTWNWFFEPKLPIWQAILSVDLLAFPFAYAIIVLANFIADDD